MLNGGLATPARKTPESNRSWRRRKQKKSKPADASIGDESDVFTVIDAGDNVEEMSDCPKAFEAVEVEYVPDQAELVGIMDEEFR